MELLLLCGLVVGRLAETLHGLQIESGSLRVILAGSIVIDGLRTFSFHPRFQGPQMDTVTFADNYGCDGRLQSASHLEADWHMKHLECFGFVEMEATNQQAGGTD
jgi:hypothetical protein